MARATDPLPADEGFLRRRREGRRARWRWAAGLPLLGGVALLDSLPALFLLVACAQTFVVVLARRRRRKERTGLETVRVEPTSVARLWFPAAWALLLAAIFIGTPPLRLVLCVLLAASLAAWPLVRAHVERVRCERRLPLRTRVGAPTSLRYRLANPTTRSAGPCVLRDALGVDVRPPVLEVLVECVPAGGEAEVEGTVIFTRRGRRRLRPVRVAARTPLGLFEASFEASAPTEVLVRPREGRARPALTARLAGRTSEASQVAVARLGASDFEGLREFRDGDDPRRIHWKTTARRGAPTFVERRDEGCRRLVVVLGRTARKDQEADLAFERAVSVVATVMRTAIRAGLQVLLLVGEDDEFLRPVRGPRGLEGALDRLARVRADGGRRPLGSLRRLPREEAATVLWVEPLEAEEALRARLEGSLGAQVDLLVLRANRGEVASWVDGLP